MVGFVYLRRFKIVLEGSQVANWDYELRRKGCQFVNPRRLPTSDNLHMVPQEAFGLMNPGSTLVVSWPILDEALRTHPIVPVFFFFFLGMAYLWKIPKDGRLHAQNPARI